MRYLAAYMLCQLGGKEHPSAGDIKNVLSAVGIEHEDSRLDLLLKEVAGKETAKLIEEGRSKMASVPMGGGTGVAAAPAATAAPAAAEAPAATKAPAKEETKEESESDADMGLGLFD